MSATVATGAFIYAVATVFNHTGFVIDLLSLFWATLIAAYVLGEPITMTRVAGLLLALSALVLQIPAWKTHEIAHRS